jgi:hypothetical protein
MASALEAIDEEIAKVRRRLEALTQARELVNFQRDAEPEPAKPRKPGRVSTAGRPTKRGRPPKARPTEAPSGSRAEKSAAIKKAIAEWRSQNPDGKKNACVTALGVSWPSVSRYW